jgi:hypothetical protein
LVVAQFYGKPFETADDGTHLARSEIIQIEGVDCRRVGDCFEVEHDFGTIATLEGVDVMKSEHSVGHRLRDD